MCYVGTAHPYPSYQSGICKPHIANLSSQSSLCNNIRCQCTGTEAVHHMEQMLPRIPICVRLKSESNGLCRVEFSLSLLFESCHLQSAMQHMFSLPPPWLHCTQCGLKRLGCRSMVDQQATVPDRQVLCRCRRSSCICVHIGSCHSDVMSF